MKSSPSRSTAHTFFQSPKSIWRCMNAKSQDTPFMSKLCSANSKTRFSPIIRLTSMLVVCSWPHLSRCRSALNFSLSSVCRKKSKSFVARHGLPGSMMRQTLRNVTCRSVWGWSLSIFPMMRRQWSRTTSNGRSGRAKYSTSCPASACWRRIWAIPT